MTTKGKKLRPSTASGIIQSYEVSHILDDIRPSTAPGVKEVLPGLEPTYVTAQRPLNDYRSSQGNRIKGRQVHGGVDKYDLKHVNTNRRATIGPTENLSNFPSSRISKRPITAGTKAGTLKIEEKITLDQLNRMRTAFEAGGNEHGTLDLENFKICFRDYLGLKGTTEEQMTSLFMKIDSTSDGHITWDDFCTYMQLEYTEKEDSYFRAKETAFHLPAHIESSPHRDSVLRICHTNDNNFLGVSQDGMVSFWSQSMNFKRTKQIESGGGKKSKWITDFILMPQYNKFIISTGDREIQFFELSTFEAYCQISSLETVPLRLDYCSVSSDECLILFGDSDGCISIFIVKNVGEVLRTWKKMPKVDGIASTSMDSVLSSPNINFVRWKVHNDWVQELRYYESIRAVISCSSDQYHSLVIGQTLGSTHVETSLREISIHSTGRKTANFPPVRDTPPKRRLDCDETTFRVYKGVRTFDFCKEKNIIATGGMDRLIRLWNPYVPSKPIGILRGHVTPIFYLFVVAEDNRLFSISNDKTIKVWDLHDQTCLLTVRPKAHKIRGDLAAIHYNPDSRGLAVVTDNMSLLSVKSKPLSHHMTTTHKESVNSVKYNRSFKQVVTASDSSIVRVWDIETGKCVFEFSNAHGDTGITTMVFDSTERRLITGSRDGRLKIWNYNNGHCLRVLEKEEDMDETTALCYIIINKNRYIVSVGWDRRVNVFSDDQSDFHHVQKPCVTWSDDIHHGHHEDILAIAFCPPNLLATSSYDGEILIWNMVSGHIFCRINTSNSTNSTYSRHDILEGSMAVSKLAFLQSRNSTKNAASLVANGPKGFIQFWNVYRASKPYAAFVGSTHGTVSAMIVDSSNASLITGDSQGFVCIWDVQDYAMSGPEASQPPVQLKWRSHIQNITSIELVEDYDILLTSSSDCTVRAWTTDGHFVGTFGQPNLWEISTPSTYQHPMAPYDVLVDPLSVPNHPVLQATKSSATENGEDKNKNIIEAKIKPDKAVVSHAGLKKARNGYTIDDKMIEDLLKSNPASLAVGKRLRHERLKIIPKDNGGPNAYQSLKYFDLEETPPLPDAPSTTDIDDPFDIKI
eukprot:gene6938-7717_t